MKYKLAKKLKDAGYPQDFRDGDIVIGPPVDETEERWENAYAPTLSELIEACGASFSHLDHVRRDGRAISTGVGGAADEDDEMVWEASCWEHTVRGESPEEAVANLWLELHKSGKIDS